MNRRYGCFLLEREVTQKVLLVVHLATHEADHRNPLASTGLVVPPEPISTAPWTARLRQSMACLIKSSASDHPWRV
jgi:hypothetical protein